MDSLSIIQKICIWALPIILSVTLHEAAHAWVAYRLGDNTAKMFGRLSLNPMRHISLYGTIIFPIVIGILTNFQFLFGWAKPVPINWSNLRNWRRDSVLVALSGPGANIIMALLWAGALKISTLMHPSSNMPALFLFLCSQAGILINLLLAFLNLIPIPPLDGSRVVTSVLPPRLAFSYSRFEPYGIFILLILMFTGILGLIIEPLLNFSLYVIYNIFRL